MKNLSLSLFMLFSVFLVLSSCQKEDDKPEQEIADIIFNGDLINPTLQELQAFHNDGYNIIKGNVILDEIVGLVNMQSFSNLESVAGYIKIRDNRELQSLEGLEKLLIHNNDLIITNNGNLKSLSGLENLQSISRDCFIEYNINLVSFDGLNNLRSVGERLVISHNPSLKNFEGLISLQEIGSSFLVSFNSGLVSSQH